MNFVRTGVFGQSSRSQRSRAVIGRLAIHGAIVLAAGLVAVSCDSTTAETTPTQPTTITTVTDTFTGTLAVSGSNVHTFKAEPGTVTVTVTSVGPTPGLAIGVIVGVWTSGGCSAVVQNSSATTGAVLSGLVTSSLEVCAQTYDVGNITDSATYSITAVRKASVTTAG